MTEDGYAILNFDRTNDRLMFHYGWARSVDITDYVPKDVISVLDKGKTYSLRDMWKINNRVFPDFIYRHSPLLLMNEFKELILRHLKDFKYYAEPSFLPRPRPSYIHMSKSDHVTVCWDFRISSHNLVKLIHDKYGILEGTWKSIVSEKYYNFYINNYGEKLSSRKLEEYYDLKRKYSYKISREWMFSKYKELFSELE